MSIREKPNSENKIPCDCCRNGKRKDMKTKIKRVCEYCNGTMMRIAPRGYQWEFKTKCGKTTPFYHKETCSDFDCIDCFGEIA